MKVRIFLRRPLNPVRAARFVLRHGYRCHHHDDDECYPLARNNRFWGFLCGLCGCVIRYRSQPKGG